MIHILTASEAELVYADSASWKTVCKAVAAIGLDRQRIILVDSASSSRDDESVTSMHDLIRQAEMKGKNAQTAAWKPSGSESNRDVPAYLSFTSGTTSLPKGVRDSGRLEERRLTCC
jgi:long-subunit acyl-CoA synthetase (AMP-forming)